MIPSPDQMLLLRACLLSGSDAATAWQAWRQRVNFDDIDAPSYRLIPLLYQNLRREKIEDELLGRFKGIYRHTWSRNQLLFHAAGAVMKAMNDAGIPVLLLKGAALVSSFYHDAGLRPMNDFDFMIPHGQALEAFEVLHKCGWHCTESAPPAQLLWCSYAGKWANHSGQQIDLHWHVLSEGRQPGMDDEAWPRAVKQEIGSGTFPAMEATDLLWHICVHGAVGDAIRPIRWVADAWTILQSRPAAIDWERLVTMAKRRHLTLVIGRALSLLREEFNAPIPPTVIQQLRATPNGWLERWETRIKAGPPGISGALPLHVVNYLRLTQQENLWRKLTGLPPFFQRVWGLPNARGLPAYIVKKAATRLTLTKN